MKPADAVIAVIMMVIRGLAFAASRFSRDGFSPLLEVA